MLIKKIKNSEEYLEHIEYIQDRPFNDKRYYISNEKIKNLGWDIRETFNEGIDNLIKNN
jgi:dTDP-D-glucose 4,6-dehydratase